METFKKEKELKNGVLTNKEFTSKWHTLKNIAYRRHDEGKKDKNSNKLDSQVPSRNNPSSKDVNGGQVRNEYPKKGGFYLELKPFKKAKTARDPDTRPETLRFIKPSDRLAREEPLIPLNMDETSCGGEQTVSSFHNTWDHVNYRTVPTYIAHQEHPKKKKPTKVRKRNKSSHRSTDRNKKEFAEEREKEIEVLFPTCGSSSKKRGEEPGGRTVVIYERPKRRDSVHQQTSDEYRLEEIAFSGNCETTVDVVSSKRSLSEPRQQLSKELYVAKRRTRFLMDPQKIPPAQSDFHSALDFLKQSNASMAFNTKIIYQNPISKVSNLVSADATGSTKSRLKETAEKKLDLHREMMRAEKTSKKKFWESIERSLNYRCALAEMLSSQSFVTQNNSKFYAATESSTGRSTNIYVRESVISSYQGFQRILTNKSENVPQTSKTYRKMKTLLDSFLIKEDEEDKILDPKIRRSYTLRCTSDSTIPNKDFQLSQTTSDTLNLLEKSLKSGENSSDLEVLMRKLSEEIRKCSLFIGEVKEQSKLSASDSKLELRKCFLDGKDKKGVCMNGFLREQAVYPLASIRKGRERAEAFAGEWAKWNKNKILMEMREMRSDCSQDLVNPPQQTACCGQQERSATSSASESSGASIECVKPSKKKSPLHCSDCNRLKKKVQKLEKELAKIGKRMYFYPVEHQRSMMSGFENLRGTSETVLKRLKSCSRFKHMDGQGKKPFKETDESSKRPQSAPGAVVHKSKKKQMSVGSTASDYQLQVGMEITMENVDPATGQKLPPEVQRDWEQEGNIQCRMFKGNEPPVLVMDTDFSYNPKTGMLFKAKDDSGTCQKSADVSIPVAEKSPAVDKCAVVDKPPVVDYCPVVEKPPVVDKCPVVEKPPVVDNCPVVEKPPVVDNCPVVEEPPVVDKCPPQVIKAPCDPYRSAVDYEPASQCSGSKLVLPVQMMPKESSKGSAEVRNSDSPREVQNAEECGIYVIREELSRVKEQPHKKHCDSEEERKSPRKKTVRGREKGRKDRESEGETDRERKIRKRKAAKRESDSEVESDERSTEMQSESDEEHSSREYDCRKSSKTEGVKKSPRRKDSPRRLLELEEEKRKADPKESKSGKHSRKRSARGASRIPTRRKPTPSPCQISSDAPAVECSVLSLATSVGSSIPECGTASKILVKNSARVKNSSQKNTGKYTEEVPSFNKTTQTFGLEAHPSEENKPSTTQVGVQTRFVAKDYGVQTLTVDSHHGTSWEQELRNYNLSDGSQENFPRKPPTPTTVSVALQVDRQARRRPTASVGLQTNLPTEESLRYMNDLRIQKKVNMAIAELCFHLGKGKEKRGV